MKLHKFAFLILTMFSLFSCNNDMDIRIDNSYYYEKMNFYSALGWFKFDLYKTNNPEYLKVIVISYFDLTQNKELIIKRTDDNSTIFDTFNDALNNRIELSGDFKHPEGLTGWNTYLYFMSESEEIEVTNSELRNELLKFHKIVIDELSKNNIKF